MTRVLITGITGMAGSHLAEYIVQNHQHVEIYGAKRWRAVNNNVSHIEDQINLIDCDLTDANGVIELLKTARPDFIFHLAAQSFVPDSWKHPQSTISDNLMMQLNLFEAIRLLEIDPVVQVALSSEEYGRVYPHELPINEKNTFRPLNPYAVSKVAQDMLAYQYFESHKLKVIRTRAFNHEGPRRGEVFVTSNFAKQIAEIEIGKRPPVLNVGNLETKRDWTDVRDVVRAYWLAVHHCKPGEDYVIASGKARAIREMVDLMLSRSTAKIEVCTDPSRLRPSDVKIIEGDPRKFKQATGWQQEYSFEQTIADVLDYWREQVRSQNPQSMPI
ncbi:MAG TPA: GDP-mannose 4,6-dehydratase [Oculatellaceae cyanobacterium]